MRSALLATALLAGCSANLPLDGTTLVTCARDADCPRGLVCVNAERCVDPEALDTGGLTLATPGKDALLAAATPVVFTWSTVAGALRYHLRVTDRAGNAVIDETLPTTSFSMAMSAGTYTWQVVSDITDGTLGVESQRFGVIEDAVFVYCGDSDCSAPGDELGTAALPFRAISRGVTGAISAGVGFVRVAKRPNDAAYAEVVTVQSGLTIVGGYTADFSAQTGRTNVALADTSLFAAFVGEPSGVQHFAFTNTAPDTSSTVASFFRCSGALELTDVVLATQGWSTNVVRVGEKVDDVGPQFIDSSITATFPPTGKTVDDDVSIIFLQNAAITLRNSDVRGTTTRSLNSKGSRTAYGINAMASTVNADHATLDLAIAGANAAAVGFEGRTTSTLSATSWQVTIAGSQIAEATGVDLADTSGTATMIDSSIDVTTSGATTAVSLSDYSTFTATRTRLTATSTSAFTQPARGVVGQKTVTIDIRASLVVAKSFLKSTGILLVADAFGVIADSTIVVIEGQQEAISANVPTMRLVNNVLIGSSTDTSAHRCGLVITDAGAYTSFGALVNNRFVGFPSAPGKTCPYARDATYSACADPNAVTSGEQHPYLAGNAALTLADANVDADYRPRTTSPLARAGIDPTSDVCRPFDSTGLGPNAHVPAPACGGVLLDFESQPFETPMPTIGYLRAAL